MPCCAAINCPRKDTKEEREKGFTFHRFPLGQPERLKQWLANLQRENYQPSTRALLCSAHFEDKYFYRFGKLTRLETNAIPTKFDFPPHLPKTEKSIKRRCKVHGPAISEDSVAASPPKREISLAPEHGPSTSESDHTYHVSTMSPRQLKRQLDELKEQNNQLQRRLKASLQKSRRLEKKVMSLSEVIDSLQENSPASNGCADVSQEFAITPTLDN